MCNGKRGIFVVSELRVLCVCNACRPKYPQGRDMSCTQFEAHAGMAAAKKWKASLKVAPGSVPEAAEGMSIACVYVQCMWKSPRCVCLLSCTINSADGSLMAVSFNCKHTLHIASPCRCIAARGQVDGAGRLGNGQDAQGPARQH